MNNLFFVHLCYFIDQPVILESVQDPIKGPSPRTPGSHRDTFKTLEKLLFVDMKISLPSSSQSIKYELFPALHKCKCRMFQDHVKAFIRIGDTPVVLGLHSFPKVGVDPAAGTEDVVVSILGYHAYYGFKLCRQEISVLDERARKGNYYLGGHTDRHTTYRSNYYLYTTVPKYSKSFHKTECKRN